MAQQLNNPSKLDRRITFQRKSIHTSSSGIAKEVWTDDVTVWASREPLRGSEFQAAAANNAENTARYRIRMHKGISADMRFIDRKLDCICNIIARPEEAKDDRSILVIMCAEELQNG